MRQASSRSEFALYAAIIVTQYAAAAGITTVYSMLSHLYREFDDPRSIGWVVTGYWLVASVCAAIGGRLGDVYGRRRIAIVMLAIAGVGSLISAQATTLSMVIAGCALQGTTGVLTPLLVGMVREHFELERVPLALGITTAAGTAGAGIAFLVAGWFIDHWSWHGGFYMKVVLVVIAMLCLRLLVPRSTAARASLAGVNLFAGVLFAPAVAGFFVALQWAAVGTWHESRVWALLAGSAALLVGWVWHQSQQATPLLDVRSLARRQVLFANLSIGILAMGCMQHGQIMSLLLQQPTATGVGFGLTATAAGLFLAPLNAIALIASPLGGSLSGRYGARAIALAGAVLVVCGWSLLAMWPRDFAVVLGASILQLFGLSMVLTAAYFAVVQATPPERTSEAMGISYVFLNLFIAIGGQSVFQLLATSTTKLPETAGTYPSPAAFSLALMFVVGTALVGALVAWALPKKPQTIHDMALRHAEASAQPRE